jgi:uncharacterized protein YjdB
MRRISKFLALLFLSIYLSSILTPAIPCQASTLFSSVPIKWLFEDSVSAEIGEEFYLFNGPALLDSAKFKSSKSSVASVDEFGLVTTKKSGCAMITATVSKVTFKYHVSVIPTAITLNCTDITLENAQTKQLTATASTRAKVTFKSSKNSVATIDESGLITAVKPGQSTITASCDGTKVTCNVTVKSPTIQLNHISVTLYRGQSVNLTANVSSNLSPTWKTNRKSVATVEANGCVTALKHGTATITATVDKVSKTCTITVIQPTITLDRTELSLLPKQTYTLHPKVTSGNYPTFRSSNDNVATVSANGMITAVGKGTAYITVSEDGVKVKCKVKVTLE